MTVSSETSKVTYVGDGDTTVFAIPFYFLATNEVAVVHKDAVGVETAWVEGTHYAISGAGLSDGGALTVETAPIDHTPVVGDRLIIKRDLDLVQETDYPEGGQFPARAHERALDRIVMLIQQLNERIDRSLQMSGTSDAENLTVPEPEAGKVLAWNSDETALENLTPNSAAYLSVSAFIQTLLDDASAAAARTTLGATGLGANTFTGLQIWAKGADIASAATLVPGTDGNYFDVTGTTGPTTAITVAAGTLFMLQFDSTPTWTHHATDLALPGAANITWAAGDRAICFAEAANQVRVLAATHAGGIIASEIANNAVTLAKLVAATQASVLVGRRSGSAGNFEEVTLGSGLSMSAGGVLSASAGAMVQLVNMTIAEAAGTTAIPMDDSLPQSTEGTEIGSQVIVLADNTNKVLILGAIQVGFDSTNESVAVALFRGTTCIATRVLHGIGSSGDSAVLSFATLDSPVTAGSVTYSVRIGGDTAGQGWSVGTRSGFADFGDTADDGLILMEIAA